MILVLEDRYESPLSINTISTSFLLIIKNDNFYILSKFQVYSTNILELRAKTKIARWRQPLTTTNFDWPQIKS